MQLFKWIAFSHGWDFTIHMLTHAHAQSILLTCIFRQRSCELGFSSNHKTWNTQLLISGPYVEETTNRV